MKLSGLLLYLLLLLSFSISGQVLNRSFELTDPMEPNCVPLYWEHENYACVHSEFIPVTERVPSEPLTWSIAEAADGDFFLVLSTGAFEDKNDASVSYAKVWQQVFLPAWTLIRGAYYFGTSDYRPYYDYGSVELIPFVDPNNPCDPNDPNDPNNTNGCPDLSVIELARCSVNDVGDFGGTEAWVPFSYTILPQQEGVYDMILSVKDGTDSIFESFFAIDNLSICGPLTPLGDVTQDCHVNMDDLALFSRKWLQICTIDPNDPNYIWDPNDPGYIWDPNDPGYVDPNNLSDPECMCADFTWDNVVDANDLYPLHDNWLINDL
jgi:hypothetical protein